MTRFSFFFNDTAPTEIYTLSLHDALPISLMLRDPEHTAAEDRAHQRVDHHVQRGAAVPLDVAPGQADRHQPHQDRHPEPDRKSTRLNSSHANISYAVFCLKK